MKRHFLLLVIYIIAVSALFFIDTKAYGEDIYRVGIGDVLQVQVLDQPGLNVSVRVSFDGTINYPYIGSVYVKNMSIAEIEAEITKQLSEGYLKYPVVNASLLDSKSRMIFTYGEINRIGAIPFTDNMTLLNMLSLSGGVSKNGLYGKLLIKRKKGNGSDYIELVEVYLNNGRIEDKKIRDMVLHIDDILIVEKSETFMVQGEVEMRGRFVLEKKMTVLMALLDKGGVTERAMFGSVKLRRKKEGVPGGYVDLAQSKLADGVIVNKEVEDILLQPDDILIIEKSESFLAQGEVMQRGRLVLENDMTVLSALLQAQGVSSDGLYGVIKIRRKLEGSDEYQDIAESKLNAGAIESSEVEKIVLKPDDILIVERNRKFFIYGELNNTGEFILTKDMTVFKAITIAGGFTKWGSSSNVKILRQGKDKSEGTIIIAIDVGDVIKGDATKDVYIQEGDVVVISTGLF